MKAQRVGYLDTLKGWSILLVVFFSGWCCLYGLNFFQK